MSNRKKRRLLTLSGCVQGVGFRPFVFRLAEEYRLVGQICNTNQGVLIDVQGDALAVEAFERDLIEKKPERAHLFEYRGTDAPLGGSKGFSIVPSQEGGAVELALLPDTAMCAACLKELFDPKDRRFRYPFLHCMGCGPRFSLFLRMPFDRKNTTMVDFPMCPECQTEYTTPTDRRFHSQTNCCPACGPKLRLLDASGNPFLSEPISQTAKLLLEGKIVAVKNTGGFLLLADATNERAIEQLRRVKQRPKKPFALLANEDLIEIDPEAKAIMATPAAPIVLIKKRGTLPARIAFESPYQGVMLPHTPLHHLLLSFIQRPLIATSGNLSGEPLCIDEKSALSRLSADAFLVHNRRIVHRLDDSVVQIIDGSLMVIRRARGYIPFAIAAPDLNRPLFGTGGHLKSTFAIGANRKIYLSQHLGDLDSIDAHLAYEEEAKSWQALLQTAPKEAVSDLHPGYYTSRFGRKKIQHHRAHVYAGMVENKLSPPFFALSWDGTGLCDDGTIWGGEAFIAKEAGLFHFARLDPFPLPGSETAVKEPRRSLLGMLHAAGKIEAASEFFSPKEMQILVQALDQKINAPLCSSMGRLFDGVSSLLGCCTKSHFEGEAPLALESLASRAVCALSYLFTLKEKKENFWTIEWKGVLKQMLEDKAKGVSLAEMALAFHYGLADLIVDLSQQASCKNVLLTGGCMQNKLLVERAIAQLRGEGFVPFWHRQVPPNDGGLSLGQVYGTILEERYVLGFAR